MKRPIYYLLCAIACTSMVSSTMPMAAVAEAIQPQAAAVQQAQADATSSDTGKAEDGTVIVCGSRHRRGRHRNIHRHQRSRHGKR